MEQQEKKKEGEMRYFLLRLEKLELLAKRYFSIVIGLLVFLCILTCLNQLKTIELISKLMYAISVLIDTKF